MNTETLDRGGGGGGAIDDILDQQQPLPLEGGGTRAPDSQATQTARDTAGDEPAADPVAQIRQQLAQERQRAELAQRARDEERQARLAAEERAAAAAAHAHGSQYELISNEIKSVERMGAMLERDLQQALIAGDAQAAAKLQREMARLETRLALLVDGQESMKEESERVRKQSEQSPARPATRGSGDPAFEQKIANLAPESQQWLRRNPDYVYDPAKHQQLLEAHYVAQRAGYQPNTPAYFRAVEEDLGLRAPAARRPDQGGTPTKGTPTTPTTQGNQQVRRPTVAAPVGRGAPAAGGAGNKPTLTRQELEVAESMKMTAAEYYENKMKIARLRAQRGF